VYLQSKDLRKEWKRSYDKKFTVKLRRSQQQKKKTGNISWAANNSYAPGVGLIAGIKWNGKEVSQERNKSSQSR
jgi:hypothetical protein